MDLGDNHPTIKNTDPDAQIMVSHTEMRAMVQRVQAAEDRAKHFKEQLSFAMDALKQMKLDWLYFVTSVIKHIFLLCLGTSVKEILLRDIV